ncbi:hypothetical protein VTO42DRAFT_7770 [Malbranchea cinnamomea]
MEERGHSVIIFLFYPQSERGIFTTTEPPESPCAVIAQYGLGDRDSKTVRSQVIELSPYIPETIGSNFTQSATPRT